MANPRIHAKFVRVSDGTLYNAIQYLINYANTKDCTERGGVLSILHTLEETYSQQDTQ